MIKGVWYFVRLRPWFCFWRIGGLLCLPYLVIWHWGDWQSHATIAMLAIHGTVSLVGEVIKAVGREIRSIMAETEHT